MKSIKLPLRHNNMSSDLFMYQESILLQSLPYIIPSVSICFGMMIDNRQCLNLAISTLSTLSFIKSSVNNSSSKQYYIPSLSKSYEKANNDSEISYPSLNHFFIGHLSKDIIILNSHSSSNIQKFTFFLINNHKYTFNYPFDGFLSLTKTYEEQREYHSLIYSFLSYLFNSTQIKHENFALYYSSDSIQSYIEFDISKDHLSYYTCSTKQSFTLLNYWGCRLNSISIGDKVHFINAKYPDEAIMIVFDSLSSLITIPSYIGQDIFDTIINLTEGKCKCDNDKYYKIIICDRSVKINELPDIILKIKGIKEEVELRIEWKNVMVIDNKINQEGKYISVLVIQKGLWIKNWKIGLPGMINKKIIFDKEDMTIGILYPLNDNSLRLTMILVFGNIIILLNGIFLLLFKHLSNSYKKFSYCS